MAVALGLTLAACGGNGGGGGDEGGETGGEAGGTVELDLLVPTYSDATKGLWEDIIAGFEEANEGITVNLKVQSWENINDVIRTKVQSDQAPDILNIDSFAGFVEDDLLYAADEVLSEETIADFQESFVQNATMDGKQYGFPFIASARALFVNEDLLSEAGATVPTSWEELQAAAQAVTDNTDAYGYGMPLGSEEAQAETAMWLFSNGGGYGTVDEITVDTPENLEAVQFMQQLIDAGLTQPDAGATQRTPMLDQFVQGQFAMAVGLTATVGMIEERNPDMNYSIVPFPAADGGESSTLGVADHLMAFKNDDDKAEAIGAFLDYFYQGEVYVEFLDTEGFLPVTKSGAELTTNEAMAPFTALLPSASFYPFSNPAWSTTQAAIQGNIGLIATGADPAQVLADIQAEADNN